MKCPMCITGNVKNTGCYLDCDSCAFTEFVMTTEYLESAKALIGETMSNRVIKTEEDYLAILERNIQVHLPQVLSYLDRVIVGRTAVLRQFGDGVKDQAINLTIGEEQLNTKPDESLVCACGATDFDMISPSQLECRDCGATFKYDEESGHFIPKLMCKCGSITAKPIDESGLSMCDGCGKVYMFSVPHDKYLEV